MGSWAVRYSVQLRGDLEESRLRPEYVQARVNVEKHHPGGAVVECLVQCPDGRGTSAEAGVDHGDVVGRDVARIRFELQLGEYALGLGVIAGDGVGVTEHRQEDRNAIDIERAAEPVDGLGEPALLAEGHPTPAVGGNEVLVELERLVETAYGGFVVAGEIERPSSMDGGDQRQRVEIGGLRPLPDGLPPPSPGARVPGECALGA